MNEISRIVQLVGAIIVLGSNVLFYWKARTGKYRSLPKEFVEIASARWALGEDKLAKADAAEALKTLPLARHLYRTYLTSVIGAGLTLLGVIIGGFGI